MPRPKGFKHSPETRAKMSASLRGRNLLSPAARARQAASLRGRKHSPEHRAKISESLRGNLNSLGRKLSPETRAKLSAVKRGVPKSPEHRAKLWNHQVMRRKHGAHWHVAAGKKGGAVSGSRPRTRAQLDQLAKARAVRRTPNATREAMLLIRRTKELRALSTDDLLIREDLAVAPDAKAHVRRLIDSRVTYSLEEARRAGYDAKRIATAIGMGERRARDVVKLVHRADAARTRRSKAL